MKDTVIKNKKWEFDDEVARCFDDMLNRSIPDYENMRELVFSVGKHFVKEDKSIMDIGCSNGNAILPFVKLNKGNYVLCDVSKSMLDLCKRGFAKYNNVSILNHDLRNGVPDVMCTLILSILTIQFTPIEYRQKIVKSIYDHIENEGAFIMVEKVLGSSYEADELFVDEYYKIKKEHAYTQEQIQSKRKSLEGVLVPITESWNIDMLKKVGFRKIECFWRYLNFAGWICIK